MTTTDLRDKIARQLNAMGWTYEGSHDPGDYDTCPDCREVDNALAEFLAPLIAREKAGAWEAGRAVGYEDGLDAANGVPGRQRDRDINPYEQEADRG